MPAEPDDPPPPDPDDEAAAAELRPTRVGGGSWLRSAAPVVAIGLSLISFGALARIAGPAPEPEPSSTPSPAPAFVAATEAPARSRSLPESLDCHEMTRLDCVAIVQAALAILPGDLPDVARAAAWTSLLCDSTIECSPADLRLSTPRGSVVLSFTDGGTEAWLNVVDRPGSNAGAPVTQAWIVAWMPPLARPPTASPSAVRSG